MLKSRIVIGDVHGCFLTLMALISKLPKGIPVTIAGDLNDRGPRSREVIEWCIANNIDVVDSNHGEFMFNEDPNWLRYGGYECLESYGCLRYDTAGHRSIVFPDDPTINVYEEHKKYLKSRPLYFEYKDVVGSDGRYLVVSHSSIARMWNASEDVKRDHPAFLRECVIWDKPEPDDIADVKEIFNIFGHTVFFNGPVIKEGFANIDTGCCFTQPGNTRKLTALQYPEMTVYQQENIDV